MKQQVWPPGTARGSVVRTQALLTGSPTQPCRTSQRVAARATVNPLPLCSLFTTETTMVTRGQASPDPSPARPCVGATPVYTGRPSPGSTSSPAMYSREDTSPSALLSAPCHRMSLGRPGPRLWGLWPGKSLCPHLFLHSPAHLTSPSAFWFRSGVYFIAM